jgi:Leucine-rich repeat (LRR) protein
MFNKWLLIFALTAVVFNVSCKKNPTVSINTAPTASFTIDPTSGTTATTFNFDATGSTDNEDETSILQVRWDWENDGTWDTDYRTLKTITQKFAEPGTYTIVLEVKDTGELVNTITKTITVSTAVPTALFTVDPTSGTTDTTFNFDASGSTDNEDETSVLQVRWDWENDGTYDTNYATTKTATHQYIAPGSYTVKLEVIDSDDLTNTTTLTVSVSNSAPTALFTTDPTTGTIDTVFDFDASSSTDSEDETSVLEVRWDWENDGTYDTNYSTTKTATHQYSSVGTYIVKLEVKDSGGLTNSAIMTVSVNNDAPTASFTINPTSGTTETTFNFDASSSTDKEDETSALQVRWDWTNDGTYDTNYSTTKVATHQYGTNGTYTVKLDVKDSDGLTNTTTETLIVQQPSTVVTFSDANFEALIRSTLSKPTGDITDLDMATITTLNGGGWLISEISGIEYCTNLLTLALWGNQIVDISDLTGLTNLSWLDLSNNQVVNISALLSNSGIGSGDTVYLTGNPLSSTSESYISDLEARGVTVYYDSGTVVTFSDANFEALIRSTLSKPTGDITDLDMATITTLNGGGWNISDISGIEYCTNLMTLALWGNQIVDISDLTGLTNLSWLDLSNNQVVNISALLSNSGIGSGDTVYLTGNPLSSTSESYISDLEARGVTVYYDGGGATIVTFSDANFEALIRTTLSKPTGDITAAEMATITTLTGNGWNISDISGIEYCTNLVTLNLEDNQLVDLSDLIGLANLNWIGLSNNQIVNINALVQNSGIGSGDTVYLNGNPLSATSISYISDLEARGVTVYHDGGTAIVFYDANFEALIRTTLSKPTGDITIADMETITIIIGDGWNIADISEIVYCTNLVTLNLEGNLLTDLSDLSGLLNLNWLDLSNNLIVDIVALVDNSGIGSGDTVYLNGNPLSPASVGTNIPILEARGVTVYH